MNVLDRMIADLREAVRLGIPHGNFGLYDPSDGTYCALGMVARVEGYDMADHIEKDRTPYTDCYDFVADIFSYAKVSEKVVHNNGRGVPLILVEEMESGMKLPQLVVRLNDRYGMEPIKIADFLEAHRKYIDVHDPTIQRPRNRKMTIIDR